MVNKNKLLTKSLNKAPYSDLWSAWLRLKVIYSEIPSQKPVKQAKKMQNSLDSFKRYLTENNLRFTQQRLLIFKIFMSEERQISPEELFHEVNNVDKNISRSTIYRTVKHFHSAGIARCIHQGNGATCYESMGDQCCQMVCERCGKKIPIRNPYFECLQQETARQEGFTLFRYSNVIYGLCCDCSSHARPPAADMHYDKQTRRKS